MQEILNDIQALSHTKTQQSKAHYYRGLGMVALLESRCARGLDNPTMGAHHKAFCQYLEDNTALLIGAGYASELFAQSEYHQKIGLKYYFQTCVLPALLTNQMRFWVSGDYTPAALVSWLRLSDEVEREILETGRNPKDDEWCCGSRLFFLDVVAPYKNYRTVLSELKTHLFPNEVASCVRRRPDSKSKKIIFFRGANVALGDACKRAQPNCGPSLNGCP